MSTDFDIIVIGAGIAGASVAAHLAETHRVAICEMEERPGYHTTGRSAAAYEPNYGPPPILALTRAARVHFEQGGYLTPRETLFFMPEWQEQAFANLMAIQQGMEEISVAAAEARFPLLRMAMPGARCWIPARPISTSTFCTSPTSSFSASAAESSIANGPVTALENGRAMDGAHGGRNIPDTDHRRCGGRLGRRGGRTWLAAGPSGCSPSAAPSPWCRARRVSDFMHWPLVGDVGETWYCKPQSGKLLVSPADATPVDPHDAYADDMTLAEGIERFQQAVDYEVTRVERTWGGLALLRAGWQSGGGL